ncbi:hypothetical protein Slin15195_G124080 [Septoria linicola]|uniref:Glycoside hydrolase family 115 protein n=1 Tax=Septoria linicola TaxID=215465 RepID=A0A9Q9B173_9PEZI|nr:hypothetical protein Slin14017_G080280 [Septoria linicola]USW59089.1 hypothetical protein Slin15195_G124080 [Septoria linicola]
MVQASVLASALFSATVSAIWQQANINFEGQGSRLAANDTTAQIRCADNDFPGVLKACIDLASDFGRVTGTDASLNLVPGDEAARSNSSLTLSINNKTSFATSDPGTEGGMIIAGTVGQSHLIDGLIQRGLIDVAQIDGLWESYTSTVVDNPIDGVSQALVIAGSDKRGTIYGLYSISEQIGVSPWYYWADAAPHQHDEIFASNVTITRGPPSVKYRGIFINDEAPALTGWIVDNFPPGKYGPGFNAEFYATVFELLLRLRANYLWPAMSNSMFNVDDPRTQPLANDYGIVMGTSHTEPMIRLVHK